MLLLHEVHEVVGAREEAFEEALRDRWLPALAASGDARPLHAAKQVHGTGASYVAVTLTALRDGAAWQRLVEAVDAGALRDRACELDELRHDVVAKLLIPLPWSPLREIDWEATPAAPANGEPALFMEDTVWPHEGLLEDYVAAAGSHYAAEIGAAEEAGRSLLRIEGAYRTAFGSHRRREVLLWQRVLRPKGLLPLITREVAPEYRAPGTWMHDALRLRDRWQSRLLRSF